jgi:uncharacterized protein HemY
MASGMMGVTAYLSFGVLDGILSQNLALVITIIISAVLYAIMVLILKIPEVSSLMRFFTEKFKKLRNR